MKRASFYVLSSLASICLIGLTLYAQQEPMHKDNVALLRSELKKFNLPEPAEDLRRNIGRKDFRFLAYCGYTCMVIGIEAELLKSPKEIEPLLDRCGSRDVDGTSDVIEKGEYEYLSKVASEYIIRYNRLLLEFVRQNKALIPNQAL